MCIFHSSANGTHWRPLGQFPLTGLTRLNLMQPNAQLTKIFIVQFWSAINKVNNISMAALLVINAGLGHHSQRAYAQITHTTTVQLYIAMRENRQWENIWLGVVFVMSAKMILNICQPNIQHFWMNEMREIASIIQKLNSGIWFSDRYFYDKRSAITAVQFVIKNK